MATEPAGLPPQPSDPYEALPLYRLWKRGLRVLRWSVWGGLLVCLTLFVGYSLLRSLPLPQVLVYQSTSFYDAQGAILANLNPNGIDRTLISLEEVSPFALDATLAVEDRRFYRHFGIDAKRILAAAWIDLKARSMVQGASTITQQLARNLYLTHEKSWARKLQEALIAMQLEARMSKDEILEKYFNMIYYGEGAYGIQAAADTYFNKKAADLTLAEAALLAGIPKNPTAYSPWNNLEMAIQRQRLVLQTMVHANVISAQEAEAAAAEVLAIRPAEEKRRESASYFYDFVLKQAREAYGIDENLLQRGGLRIYTTLDKNMQQVAEESAKKYLPADSQLQVALVAIDPHNGEIKAWLGGRDYEQSPFNRVLAYRQPGSSFKPFLYLAALEEGWTAATMLRSEPTPFTTDNGTVYAPQNFANQYPLREISMRYAIAHSDNIYAVKTNMALGPEKLVQSAHRLGIESSLMPFPSLALGSEEVTPLEMAQAYATLANQGVRVENSAIRRIEDASGRVLAENKPQSQRVAPAQETFILTNMMQSVFDEGGTANRAKELIRRPVAGKTGTTPSDAWMTGFTPYLAVSVWLGYDDARKMDAQDSRLALPLWSHFIETASASTPADYFAIPEGLVSRYIDPRNGSLANDWCPTVTLEVFKRGTAPTEVCQLHQPPTPDLLPEATETSPQKTPWWRGLHRWFR